MSSEASTRKDNESFTYQGKTLSRDQYLGDRGFGPLADQFIDCPKCGKPLHRFAIRCDDCGALFREIGKIDAGPKGSAGKGIGFVVGVLIFALAAMVLGERGVSGGYPLPAAIAMAVSGLLLGVNGLLGLLYFRYFALVTFLRGLVGFGLGAVSFIVAVILLVLLV